VVIGIERQYRQRTAGLRTSALVATGSALFVLATALTSTDTSIAAQVVSGVGFLCAGVIIRDGLNIRGLNAAGTLWCASSAGVLAGTGNLLLALIGALVVLCANLLLRPLARVVNCKSSSGQAEMPVRYLLRVICLNQRENHIRSLLLQGINGGPLLLRALQSEDTVDVAKIEVRAELQCEGHQDTALEQVVARLSLEESVSSVRWEITSDDAKEELGTLLAHTPPDEALLSVPSEA
jgi:putative Mg2+ transporter-C (MgtC) family protein